jgi:hypothetical protein
VYPKKFPKKLAANEKVLWKLGNLKTFYPNVRLYKLLMLNYLQMLGSFRPPKQMYKRITKVQLLPSAPNCHNTMLAAGKSSSDDVVHGQISVHTKSSKNAKSCPTKHQS